MQNVTEDRWKYIGGSDVPIVMGLSPFKTRWELLQEKAQIKENDFEGNIYTEYGNIMEPKIREYVNEFLGRDFKEDKVIDGSYRYHADGFDSKWDEVLEIKTTSRVHAKVEDYKTYLVQLLFGIELFKDATEGYLAVYERPDDFSEELDPFRLQIFKVKHHDYLDLIDEIFDEVERFEKDLERLRADNTLTEQDLQPMEVVNIAKRLFVFERILAECKELEAEYKTLKEKLFDAMYENGLNSWRMDNGTKISLIKPTPDSFETVRELDEDALKRDLPELFRDEEHGGYVRKIQKPKKGRKGYVRITVPKEK